MTKIENSQITIINLLHSRANYERIYNSGTTRSYNIMTSIELRTVNNLQEHRDNMIFEVKSLANKIEKNDEILKTFTENYTVLQKARVNILNSKGLTVEQQIAEFYGLHGTNELQDATGHRRVDTNHDGNDYLPTDLAINFNLPLANTDKARNNAINAVDRVIGSLLVSIEKFQGWNRDYSDQLSSRVKDIEFKDFQIQQIKKPAVKELSKNIVDTLECTKFLQDAESKICMLEKLDITSAIQIVQLV